jgi:hypothetical protein
VCTCDFELWHLCSGPESDNSRGFLLWACRKVKGVDEHMIAIVVVAHGALGWACIHTAELKKRRREQVYARALDADENLDSLWQRRTASSRSGQTAEES